MASKISEIYTPNKQSTPFKKDDPTHYHSAGVRALAGKYQPTSAAPPHAPPTYPADAIAFPPIIKVHEGRAESMIFKLTDLSPPFESQDSMLPGARDVKLFYSLKDSHKEHDSWNFVSLYQRLDKAWMLPRGTLTPGLYLGKLCVDGVWRLLPDHGHVVGESPFDNNEFYTAE